MVLRAAYTLCAFCGIGMTRRDIGASSSLTRIMCSMRIIRQQCCGPSDMSGPVARSLILAVISTGPPLWCMKQVGQANSCTERRAWTILLFFHEICDVYPEVTHPWYANDAGAGGALHRTMSPPGRPDGTFPLCWDTYQIWPRAYWLYCQIAYRGRRLISGGWGYRWSLESTT